MRDLDMKCLNCGCESKRFICPVCKNNEVLKKIFFEIMDYKPYNCENKYLAEYGIGLPEGNRVIDIIPSILEQFDTEKTEFYYCMYYRKIRDNRFEDLALKYLESNDLKDINTQHIMYELIESYIPNDFIKPQKWCEIIYKTEMLSCELYAFAAKYFAMIGEYDIADNITERAVKICNDVENRNSIFYSLDNMNERLEKQKIDTNRYRTKRPYWPITEERRRAVAVFYDKKGIKYPSIEKRPKKIREDEFEPIRECSEHDLSKYCVFWCSEVFAIAAPRSIYQIAAVKIVDGKIVDSFESFVRPWGSSTKYKEKAAKEVGVSLDVIESANNVEIVFLKFMKFVEDNVLISTDALGNQGKLISRAARYSRFRKIENKFLDLLDLAADISEEFDYSNNTREYLLSYFSIEEGKTALEKAQINEKIYSELRRYGR